jgi:hypothetical protein
MYHNGLNIKSKQIQKWLSKERRRRILDQIIMRSVDHFYNFSLVYFFALEISIVIGAQKKSCFIVNSKQRLVSSWNKDQNQPNDVFFE